VPKVVTTGIEMDCRWQNKVIIVKRAFIGTNLRAQNIADNFSPNIINNEALIFFSPRGRMIPIHDYGIIDVDATDDDDATALMWAAMRGQIDAIDLLLRVGRLREDKVLAKVCTQHLLSLRSSTLIHTIHLLVHSRGRAC
jgi:hypothetical protein